MGLDIYLYTRDQAQQNADYDVACEALYAEGPDGKSPGDLMSNDEHAAWSKDHSYAPHEDAPSERYPDHLFNRRYLRSSYNGGGFNHAVPQLLSSSTEKAYPNERGSLYWIFEPMGREWDGDKGVLTTDDLPKLEQCKARAQAVVDELRSSDRLRVLTVAPNLFGGQPSTSDVEALQLYRGEAGRKSSFGVNAWYSSLNLDVYGEGATVLAAVSGLSALNVPATHLIYRAKDDGFDSYVQSAEIVVEFCDEAIALVQRDGGASMSWSG